MDFGEHSSLRKEKERYVDMALLKAANPGKFNQQSKTKIREKLGISNSEIVVSLYGPYSLSQHELRRIAAVIKSVCLTLQLQLNIYLTKHQK